MKILRLRLRHFRGIDDREIHFAPEGVTLVEGPNEIGKSCVAEAIDLVFDERDDAKNARVRAVKPVHRDEGAEIEVDVETGPYAFTLTKRFHRKTATTLRVDRPERRNLTGREAHEHVRSILEETIDPVLWRALRIEQGKGLEQAALEGQTALASAYERGGGEAAGGAREESLVEAARTECERYYTPKTGAETGVLATARRAAAAASAEVERLAAESQEFEAALTLAERLRAERPALEARDAEAERVLRECDAALERSRTLEEALVRAVSRREVAEVRERESLRIASERSALVTALVAAEAKTAALERDLAAGEAPLAAARRELEQADRASADARHAVNAAELASARSRRDRDFRDGERELRDLDQRLARVTRARREAAAAAERLAGIHVDEAAAREIQRTEMAVERARSQVAVQGPALHVTAEQPLAFDLDGRRVVIEPGESRELHVSESLLLAIPGVGQLALRAGAAVAEHRKVLEQAQTRHRERCAEAAVADHAEALQLLEVRREATATLAARDRVLEECLGGQDEEALALRAERLRGRVAAYPGERGDDPPLPPDADAAGQAVESAETSLVEARERAASCDTLREAMMSRHRTLDDARRELESRLDLERESTAGLAGRLGEARRNAEDEDVEEHRIAASAGARAAEAAEREARERSSAIDPTATAARAEVARDERSAAAEALRCGREEAIGVESKLESAGGTGLYERCEQARALAWRAERDLEREARRAGAARLLYDTLREARDAARSGVAGPLHDGIRTLGAPLFGETFDVELDESLAIASRTVEGVTLPFASLSAGAREQLSLVARLACAMAVSEDGGAPVILDDALGHSDAGRLAELGAVITAAGRSCQVIVLTCAPDRYAHVVDARVVALR